MLSFSMFSCSNESLMDMPENQKEDLGNIQKRAQESVIKGVPNVIAQLTSENEFVRVSDGSVTFLVYDDKGQPSPNAKVKGLPGIKNPNKIYTANSSGLFIVPKEDLPTDKAAITGITTEVEYFKSTGKIVKESSARNTYVPNRMQVRIRLESLPFKPYLAYEYIDLPFVIERKTEPNAEWTKIPTNLEYQDRYKKLSAYRLSNPNDPTSYTESSKKYNSSYQNYDIANSFSIGIFRMVKQSKYGNPRFSSELWDGQDHYFNVVLSDGIYGEKPHANTVIKLPPMQYMPLPKNIKAYNFDKNIGKFSKIEGELDIEGAGIDYNLIYKHYLAVETKKVNGNEFTYLSPVIEDKETILNHKMMFLISAENTNFYSSLPLPFSTPKFNFNNVPLNTKVKLSLALPHYYFYTWGEIGNLQYVQENGKNILKLVANKANYPNLPNIDIEEIKQ